MSKDEITTRLAITNMDFDSVALSTIFKIFESIIGNKISKISLFGTGQNEQYAVVEFTDKRHAKEAYDSIDGLEIETTGNIFDLSFVPTAFKGDVLLSECYSSYDYKGPKETGKRRCVDETAIQLSDELEVNFDIPDEFRTMLGKEAEEQSTQKQIVTGDDVSLGVSKALKSEEHERDHDGFSFDIKDDRFQSLFDDDDFIIDASNRKSRQQQASRVIIGKRQERRMEQ